MTGTSRRILCVGTHQTPSNAYRRALRFRALGHEVETLNTSRFGLVRWSRVQAIIRRLGRQWITRAMARALIRKIECFGPEIVFFEKSQWLKPEAIEAAREAGPEGMQLVHYNPDEFFGEHSPKRWGYFEEAIPFYDLHLVPKELNREDYLRRGARRVFVYDRSYDPSLHKPLDLTEEERVKYDCEIGFIGKYAPYREEVLAELIREGFPVVIWGNGFQRGPNWETIKPHWRGPGQYNEDYTKAINGMRIALHFLRRENRDLQDSRSFEIPACGRCMVAERTSDHERLFEDGKEAVYFDAAEDLKSTLRRLLDDPERCARIGQSGLERCRTSPYSHDDRLKEFISVIDGVETSSSSHSLHEVTQR